MSSVDKSRASAWVEIIVRDKNGRVKYWSVSAEDLDWDKALKIIDEKFKRLGIK